MMGIVELFPEWLRFAFTALPSQPPKGVANPVASVMFGVSVVDRL
jgi:hypothetical protein